MKLVTATVLAVLAGTPVYGIDDSGNHYRPACSAFLKANYIPRDAVESFEVGNCVGTVRTLMALGGAFLPGKNFCIPKGVDTEQTMRVILSYMEQHPAKTHEPFLNLAINALSAAWPCSRGPS